MSRRHYLTILILLGLLLPALSPASTLTNPGPVMLASSDGVTLEQATDKVRRETGGRILSASESRRDGRKIYRIKVLLPSGHVRVVTVNADGS